MLTASKSWGRMKVSSEVVKERAFFLEIQKLGEELKRERRLLYYSDGGDLRDFSARHSSQSHRLTFTSPGCLSSQQVFLQGLTARTGQGCVSSECDMSAPA